jgi:hypothetical protein
VDIDRHFISYKMKLSSIELIDLSKNWWLVAQTHNHGLFVCSRSNSDKKNYHAALCKLSAHLVRLFG